MLKSVDVKLDTLKATHPFVPAPPLQPQFLDDNVLG